MKKKRINLLQNRYDYYALERMFRWLKRGIVVYSILFVIGALASLGYFLMKTREAEQVEGQKKLLLLGSNTQKNDEAKLLLLSKK
ncbi:hypothetical protein HYS00_05100, partial [Candidatus Microgenomates bacterium]|nr:hypothetical protein [Candidatus Microgenomates bacterium]